MSASLSAGELYVAAPHRAITPQTVVPMPELTGKSITATGVQTRVLAIALRLSATFSLAASGAVLTDLVMTNRADMRMTMWFVAPIAAALLAFMLVASFVKSRSFWAAAALVAVMIGGVSGTYSFVWPSTSTDTTSASALQLVSPATADVKK